MANLQDPGFERFAIRHRAVCTHCGGTPADILVLGRYSA
jgi:hypothetical protein